MGISLRDWVWEKGKKQIWRNFTYFPCHDGMPQWYRIGGNLHGPLVALKKVSTNQIDHTDDIHSIISTFNW